jgi:hypothetical protein
MPTIFRAFAQNHCHAHDLSRFARLPGGRYEGADVTLVEASDVPEHSSPRFLLMNRLPALPLVALMAACGGAEQSSAAPHAQTVHVAGSDDSSPPTPISAPAAMRQPAAAVVDEVDALTSQDAPRWSWLFSQYFAAGTDGACGRSRACHASDVADAPSTYAWLERRGYIAGARSPLISTSNSCLRWFGGNMPPRGKPNAQAARDLSAWVAAGAPND